MDVESAEFKTALRDHAKSLGVDPDAEPQLLSIVQEALLAELPDGWEQGETEDGTPYYFNTATEESIWEHPLDAHYRDVIKTAKAQASSSLAPASSSVKPPGKEDAVPPAPAKPPVTDAISSLEVYSFDDVDSEEEDVKPPKDAPVSSRIASLFSQPARARAEPLVSSTTRGTTATATAPAPSTSGSASALASTSAPALAPASATASAKSAASGGGFGRDRSWLLDDSDDSVAPLKAAEPATNVAPSVSSGSLRASSSLSFTSRLFGTSAPSLASSAAPPANSSSQPLASSASLTTAATNSAASASELTASTTSPSSSPKQSPRRGLTSAIKSPFFQDIAASTLSSSFASAPSSLAAAATTAATAATEAAAKIKDLERRVQELEKTNADHERRHKEQLKQLDGLRGELEAARQDAKEANYLKMKANEHKAKLAERDAELQRARDELRTQSAAAQELRRQLDRALSSQQQQQQASASSQELLDAKKVAASLQAELSTSQSQTATLEAALEQARSSVRDAEARARSAAEAHTKERSALEQQHASETSLLRSQLASAQRELEDRDRRSDSLSVLQETLERQTKHVKELEEKLKDAVSRLEQSEGRENAARRELQQQQMENEALARRLASAQSESESRDRQLREAEDRLRVAQSELQEASTRSLARQRLEDDTERQRQALEQDRLALVAQVREKAEQLVALQTQLKRQQEQAQAAASASSLELQDLRAQLQAQRTQHVLPLEKARDQLESDNARALERVAALDKELRGARQELAAEATRSHQLQVEVEAWKRREQQQKTQRDAAMQDKQRLEKELAAVEADAAAFKHEKRLEGEKQAFRQRELESLVAQKDYEIVRVEERFTKAEAWRLKEARRVEERDAQLLAVREELAQLRARHVEQENCVIVQELRREKELLEQRVRQLSTELEEQRVARELAAQKWQDEAEATKKAIEWQLPQLAAACVTRSSEEWARKCQQVAQSLRDELQLQALTERNALLRRVAEAEDAREHIEAKYKTSVAECEFLRKEVHRVEDSNKVLLDQLHTIRVYLTQYRGPWLGATPTAAAAGPAAPVAPASSAASPAASTSAVFGFPAPHAPMSVPMPAPMAFAGDYATVNHLNAQLAMLHAQFQQLFDNADDRRPTRFSPSDRFEMPPPSPVRKPSAYAVSVHETREPSSPTLSREQQQREKEELLASLEALGETSPPARRPAPEEDALAASTWYRRDYWRGKYQT
ncbi:hypothetical protein P43SY_011469 [Pythium insidiosum]|uniref:WW domain-containing protein n=1 Tax=Pythium insidiosum TaxID=114742 RepID=A0AAD5LVP4_PYTIN|nr:hypothetical protein P43SY_011469 [Pythium insidiosum]